MEIRKATADDLPAIVRLLAEDELGATREEYAEPLPQAYLDAFAAMQKQGGNDYLVAIEDGARDDTMIGCLQLTLIPGLSRRGMTRAQIEGVRVHKGHRGKQVGEKLMQHAIDLAKEAGCGLVQLTTDKARPDAHRFYERLGFTASHEGMKLSLDV